MPTFGADCDGKYEVVHWFVLVAGDPTSAARAAKVMGG